MNQRTKHKTLQSLNTNRIYLDRDFQFSLDRSHAIRMYMRAFFVSVCHGYCSRPMVVDRIELDWDDNAA